MPIKILRDGTGWEFAVIAGDSHAGVWCSEQLRLDYDRSVEEVLRHLKSGDIAVDAGAFIGAYSVSMAKFVGATGRILSFEPNLESFCCLSVNSRDLPQIQCFNMALGEFDCRLPLVRDKNCGATHIDEKHTENSESIRIIALDDLKLERCDFIKADLEGYEPFFIQGAMKTIERFKPKIFIELNDEALARYGFKKTDILNPLFELGYRLEFLDAKNHSLNMKQLDVFLFP